MIPLRDTIPSRTFPVITIGLIAANIAVFIYEVSLGENLEYFIRQFAFIPGRLTAGFGLGGWERLHGSRTLLTAMFLHGSWMHLIGNMWYLWIFGDNVEDRVGHFKYLLFYLTCGICGNIAQVIAGPGSLVPALGASGAVAAVLGAYFLLFPGARVITLIPLFIFWEVIEIPAIFFLGVWFIMQFLNGMASLPYREAQAGGIAWWAHIAGFASGMTLVMLFAGRKKRRYR